MITQAVTHVISNITGSYVRHGLLSERFERLYGASKNRQAANHASRREVRFLKEEELDRIIAVFKWMRPDTNIIPEIRG